MATVADGIDLVCAFVSGQSTSATRAGQGNALGLCYVVLAFLWLVIFGKYSDRDFSAILTAASFVQCGGFLLLSVKVHGAKSVAGISSKSLVMFTLFLMARLTSTSLRNGYIPMDSTGDFLYQLIDGVALLLVVKLLHAVHKTHGDSYQEEFDTLPLLPLVVPCVVVGCFVHGHFNGSKFFDVVWAISTNLETLTMVPQLWMMSGMRKVDSMTAHYVACTVLSTVLTFTWWWYCGNELEKRGPCLLAKVIMVAQLFKLLMSADFMYYYALAWIGGGELVLPEQEL